MLWLANLLALALATGAVIDVLHNGTIFATWRATTQARQDAAEPESWGALWYELLLCGFCKSYWIPLILALAVFAPTFQDAYRERVGLFFRVLTYALAATRLSNLINGLLPGRLRYDREDDS